MVRVESSPGVTPLPLPVKRRRVSLACTVSGAACHPAHHTPPLAPTTHTAQASHGWGRLCGTARLGSRARVAALVAVVLVAHRRLVQIVPLQMAARPPTLPARTRLEALRTHYRTLATATHTHAADHRTAMRKHLPPAPYTLHVHSIAAFVDGATESWTSSGYLTGLIV